MTAPLGLVERLRNGGQTDLADMAQELIPPEGFSIAPDFRGYALMGAGAYILTVCDGDERGPELVISLATDDEKATRTIGDLRDVVKGVEIPLDRTAIRLQFSSVAGLDALEQQLRFIRDELTKEQA